MKKLILLWICLVCIFAIVAPKTQNIQEKHSAIPNILTAKLIGSFIAPIWSDILWIGSASEGEIKLGTYNVDFEKFFARFKLIAALNGDFIEPINYGSLYMASIAKHPNDGLDIIMTAQKSCKNNQKLNEIELLYRIVYERPVNFERIRFLAQNTDSSFISSSDALAYAANDEIKKNIAKSDLQNLAKNAKNKAQKTAAIEALKRLDLSY